MSQPYVGEIRLFGGNFAPAGWAKCHGQALPISEYETLFVLIGTTYGGDGQETFHVPDLRGRVPIHMGSHMGNSYQIGEMAGSETVTLTVNQIPGHTHSLLASMDIPTGSSPEGNVTGQAAAKLYRVPGTTAAMHAQSISPAGGSQPHENMQQYLCVTYIIALFGIFPTPT